MRMDRMDQYTFEDFMEKPYERKGKRKELTGLSMETSVTCLLYIYLNSWNSQAVVSQLVNNGIWSGMLSLILVSYFFTLPTITFCLYLGKFLKNGAFSLHKCCPLLFGVEICAYILAYPLGAIMVYYPLSENMFMLWLFKFKGTFPSCNQIKKDLNFNVHNQCMEDIGTYKCCISPMSTLSNIEVTPDSSCEQPMYPALIVFEYLAQKCYMWENIFTFRCPYWFMFLVLCLLCINNEIKSYEKLLELAHKWYFYMVVVIIVWSLSHIETVINGVWFFYFKFDLHENIIVTTYVLLKFEVDNLSSALPFILMMGRLIDDSVHLDELAVKLALDKLSMQFWQSNEYICVISVVSSHYKVPYNCIQNYRMATAVSLGVIPQFFNECTSRIFKYPAMTMYFLILLIKKLASMLLFGNLLSYHLYYIETEDQDDPNSKEMLKKKCRMTLIRFIVMLILGVCQGFCNTHFPEEDTLALRLSLRLILMFQFVITLIVLLSIYSVKRFKQDVEASVNKRIWPYLSKHLKLQYKIAVVYGLSRITFNVVNVESTVNSILQDRDEQEKTSCVYQYYLILSIYLATVVLLTLLYIVYIVLFKGVKNILNVSCDWGPVIKRKWKNIRPYKPSRRLKCYNPFLVTNHLCFKDDCQIKEEGLRQEKNIRLFATKWPSIFKTKKYEYYKDRIDNLITEAYQKGILKSYENDNSHTKNT